MYYIITSHLCPVDSDAEDALDVPTLVPLPTSDVRNLHPYVGIHPHIWMLYYIIHS